MKRHHLAVLGVLVAAWSILSPSSVAAQSSQPFVPTDFDVPASLETEQFILRMLTVNDVVKDYDAVMTSVEHLRGVFGPQSKWPKPDLSLEQDLIDLGWHQKEFQRRSSFAYTVMNPSESECLGCVYVVPTRKQGYDAAVYLWVRKSEFVKGLDPILFKAVKEWLSSKWRFEKVAYPGREIDWEAWQQIPSEQ
jgi:hypothetical protein